MLEKYKSRFASDTAIPWFVENFGPLSYRTGAFWRHNKNNVPYFEIHHQSSPVKAFNNRVLKLKESGAVDIVYKFDQSGEQERRTYVISPKAKAKKKASDFYLHEDLCNAVMIAFEKSALCENWQRFGRSSLKISTDKGPVGYSPDRHCQIGGRDFYFEIEISQKREKDLHEVFRWYRAAIKQGVIKGYVIYAVKDPHGRPDKVFRDWLRSHGRAMRLPETVQFATISEVLATPLEQGIYHPSECPDCIAS